MANRRDVMLGLAATAAGGSIGGVAFAATAGRPLFAGTPLATNSVAAKFHRVDMKLPSIPVNTVAGIAPLSRVGGKSRLIALWAEWCVPCLVEIRDFAALRPAIANDRFDIGLLLTASSAKLDRVGAIAKLRTLGADAMPLLIEPDGGSRAAEMLATREDGPLPPGARRGGFSMPCVLLVDARGRVRGRSFGSAMLGADGKAAKPALTDEQKAALKRGEKVVTVKTVTDADKGEMLASGRTVWSGPEGRAFLQALANGALDRA